MKTATATLNSTKGSDRRTSLHREASSPPASQKSISRWASRFSVNSMIAEMMAAMKALTATPDSSSADMENRPPTDATANTRTKAPVAPAKDIAGRARAKAALRPGGDGYDRPQRPAGGHADDARVRHRVAEQSLHHRPGHAQGRAYGQRQGDAGQPDGGDYGLFSVRRGGLSYPDLRQQYVSSVGKRDGVGAEGGGDNDQDDSRRKQRYGPPGQPQQHRGAAQHRISPEPAQNNSLSLPCNPLPLRGRARVGVRANVGAYPHADIWPFFAGTQVRRTGFRCMQQKIPAAFVTAGTASADLALNLPEHGRDLSTPWTKSDRSAQPGRSPGSRLIASPAPSHPLADSGFSGRLPGYSGASAADSHRFPCSRPPVGRAGLVGLNFAECYQRLHSLSTADQWRLAFRGRWFNQLQTGVWIPAKAGTTYRKVASHLNRNVIQCQSQLEPPLDLWYGQYCHSVSHILRNKLSGYKTGRIAPPFVGLYQDGNTVAGSPILCQQRGFLVQSISPVSGPVRN